MGKFWDFLESLVKETRPKEQKTWDRTKSLQVYKRKLLIHYLKEIWNKVKDWISQIWKYYFQKSIDNANYIEEKNRTLNLALASCSTGEVEKLQSKCRKYEAFMKICFTKPASMTLNEGRNPLVVFKLRDGFLSSLRSAIEHGATFIGVSVYRFLHDNLFLNALNSILENPTNVTLFQDLAMAIANFVVENPTFCGGVGIFCIQLFVVAILTLVRKFTHCKF